MIAMLWNYNWRNLLARPLSTALTLIVVAVMVAVLSLLLAFDAGIRASLVATGSARNLIVLKPGATSESTSLINSEETARLAQTPGLARDAAGAALISLELCVQTDIPRRGSQTSANVALRGVDDVGFAVHPEVRVTEGRGFQQGALEVIVGRAARDRFTGLEVGSAIDIGRRGHRRFQIVGIFEAGGGALESEVWAPRTMLADAYHATVVSSACLRLTDAKAAADALTFIQGPTVKLEGKTEADYYESLATTTRDIVRLTGVLIGIMAIGAIFAVANTMYAAVDGRRREIAMLRAIGFGRGRVVAALVSESLLLSMGACVGGLGLSQIARLVFGARQDYLSDRTWTVLAFDLRMTTEIIGLALVLACLVGAFGALAPALRAARLNVLEALRKA